MPKVNLPPNWSEKVIRIHADYQYDISANDYLLDVEENESGWIGDFATPSYIKGDIWSHNGFIECREEFHGDFYKTTKMLYNVGVRANIIKVAKLVHQTEEALGLKTRTKVGITSVRNVVWLQVPRWWTYYYSLRRSFYTAMLRAALEYNGRKPLLWNLKRCEYLGRTSYATERFINGYTKVVTKGLDVTKDEASYEMSWFSTFYDGRYYPLDQDQWDGVDWGVFPMDEKFVDKLLRKA